MRNPDKTVKLMCVLFGHNWLWVYRIDRKGNYCLRCGKPFK